MPQAGDSFITTIGEVNLDWGERRYTDSREKTPDERYLSIPKSEALRLNIVNSNAGTGLGVNYFNGRSSDGVFEGLLLAGGCKEAGDIYAKNLAGKGEGGLCALEPWLTSCNAQPGDQVEVKWISSEDIELRFISQH